MTIELYYNNYIKNSLKDRGEDVGTNIKNNECPF